MKFRWNVREVAISTTPVFPARMSIAVLVKKLNLSRMTIRTSLPCLIHVATHADDLDFLVERIA
jgi:hypothetical protein